MTEKKKKELSMMADKVRREFGKSTVFKESKNIIRDARRSINFYEGRQWDEVRMKTNFEKAIMNVIQNTVDTKAASILSKNYKINFIVDNDDVSTENVNKFAEWQMKEMNQQRLNKSGTYDGLLKGTWIWYYLWDEDAVGQMGVQDGGIRAICIDIGDIAVANPREEDEQRQEWIIVRTREQLDKVREMAVGFSEKEKKELLVHDHFEATYSNDVEQDGDELVTVYTKFFRKNNEVHFIKCTEDIVFQDATSINPLTNERIIKESLSKEDEKEENFFDEESPNIGMYERPNSLSEQEFFEQRYKSWYYPFVFGSFVKREQCIYGLSWSAQLIPTQKQINSNINANFISATKTALPTIVVKKGALGGQILDFSKPGAVITDHTPVGTQGISLLNTGTIPTAHFELAQSTIALMKDVYRANDVLNDGSRSVATNSSGYAINQLLSIQEQPIAQWQQELVDAITREGKILEQFYKLYYRNKTYSASYTDAERMQLQDEGFEAPQSLTATFDGSEYLDTLFNVSVEVGEGGKYSELANTTMVETLFNNGMIDKMSTDSLLMLCEMAEDSMFPSRKKFKRLVERKQQSELAQLQQENAQLKNMLNLEYQRGEAMKEEYTNKVNIFNEQLAQAKSMLDEYKPTKGVN